MSSLGFSLADIHAVKYYVAIKNNVEIHLLANLDVTILS